jgi:hypothetical protein
MEAAGTAWTASANNRNYNNWSGTNNHPVGTKYKIEYDSKDFKFGIAHGNYNGAGYISKFGVGPTTLETPIFSLVGLNCCGRVLTRLIIYMQAISVN